MWCFCDVLEKDRQSSKPFKLLLPSPNMFAAPAMSTPTGSRKFGDITNQANEVGTNDPALP